MSRRRALSPAELGLWRKVVAGVTPLAPRIPQAPIPPDKPERPDPPPEPVLSPSPESIPSKKQKIRRAPSGVMQPADERHIRRGRRSIDARLDLHGFTQDHAYSALHRFIAAQRSRGARLVLVITGKGRPDEAGTHGTAHGVLRRMVPAWLAGPALAEHVVSYGEALPRHGGGGALYVMLRKVRE